MTSFAVPLVERHQNASGSTDFSHLRFEFVPVHLYQIRTYLCESQIQYPSASVPR